MKGISSGQDRTGGPARGRSFVTCPLKTLLLSSGNDQLMGREASHSVGAASDVLILSDQDLGGAARVPGLLTNRPTDICLQRFAEETHSVIRGDDSQRPPPPPPHLEVQYHPPGKE